MIRHILIWSLKADDAQGKADAVARIGAALMPLVDLVPGLEWLEVHADVHETEGNSDVVLTSHFASRAALEEYQVHPVHQEAAAVIRSLVTARVCVDYELG